MAKKDVNPAHLLIKLPKHYFAFLIIVLLALFLWQQLHHQAWWRFSLSEQINQQPLFYRNKIILATNHGTLVAIDERTGSTVWTKKYEKDVSAQPFVKNDLLYTGYVDGTVVAIDPINGSEVWRYTIPNSKLIYTGLTYSETQLIFGDSGGVIHALSLRNGQEKWSFATPNPETIDQLVTKDGITWFGTILFDRGKLYVIRTHGYIAEIDASSGKVNWQHETHSIIRTEPLLTRTSLLLSNDQHRLLTLNRQNGEVVASTESTNTTPVTCQVIYAKDGVLSDMLTRTGQNPDKLLLNFEQEIGDQVIQVDSLGHLQAYERATLTPSWELQLNFAPTRCFFDQERSLYLSSKDGQLATVELSTHTLKWQRQFNTNILTVNAIQKTQSITTESTKKYYYTNLVFISDDHEQLKRIDPKTGNDLWSFQTDGALYIPPLLRNNKLLVVSTNGGLYRLKLANGEPDVSEKNSPVTLKANQTTVSDGQIYEVSLRTPHEKFVNPHTEVNIDAEFSGPDGKTFPINGFYYQDNEWRLRFNPPTPGKWSWKVTWNDSFQTKSFMGDFTSLRSYKPLHTIGNSRWLTKDGKTIQPIVGMNDCLVDLNKDGSPLNDFFISDEGLKIATTSGDIPETLHFNQTPITLEQYLDTYKPGFNLFRETISNCSPPLYYGENFLYSRYLAREGSYYDQVSQSLFSKGYSVWFTLFGFSLPFEGAINYPDERVALENYIKYVVARYGAYVDVWEISNEAVASDEYVQVIAELLKKNDPFHRLVTVSWDKPNLKEISLIAPHWYQNEGDNESDLATINQLKKYQEFQKPVIFGEQGNKTSNWDPTSADRMRVRIWTAFFHQAGMVFWNQSSSKNFYNPTFENSNIYLGNVERQYAANFLELTQELPIDLLPGKDPNVSLPVRSYTLKNDTLFLQYSFHPEYTAQTTTTLTNPFSKTALVDWFDPVSGKFIRRDQANANATITSPTFTRDLFAKVRIE